MNKYIGVKLVEAEPMTLNQFNSYMNASVTEVADSPDREGYLVEYPEGSGKNHDNHDGYVAWCPKHVFEEANRPVEGMSFGHALEAAKKGHKIARAGWNGKGMFLQLQSPDENSKMTFPYLYFTIPDCEEGTRLIPYGGTIVDYMSDDWVIVD